MSLETKRIKELFGYARTLTKEQGVGVMAGRAVGFFKRRFFGKKARYLPSKHTLDAQRADAAANAAGWPTISILTPLYNTPPQFLQQFLDSVQAQTAPNWQLVLVDASDDAHADVGRAVQARAAQDSRIVYAKIKNAGIAANTNEAAKLATGDYLALADHDDMLAPHAVYCMSKALAESGVLHLVSLTELDQSHRRCSRGTAPAAGAEGLGRGFGALVGMDAAADITAGTACPAAVRTAAEGASAKVITPAAAAEAVLVIGAEFRFRLALPAHILRRDLI